MYPNNDSAMKRYPSTGLFLRTCMVLLFVVTTVVQPAFSQDNEPESITAPMPTWNLVPVDAQSYFTNMTDRSLAFKASNMPCVVYGGDALYYSCRNPTTGAWNKVVVDNSIGVGQYAALTFYYSSLTGNNEAYVSYYDAYYGRLKVAYTYFGVWQAPMVIPTPLEPYPSQPDALDLQEPASPIEDLDFTEQVKNIQYPWRSTPNEYGPDLFDYDSRGVGKFTSIAADQYGIYVSFYDDRTDAGFKTLSLNVARWNGTGPWEVDVIDWYHDHKAVGKYTSLKVDYNHNLHVAYFDEKYDDLKYAFWNHNKDEWTILRVDGDDPITNVGAMCSLALYDSQTPTVAGVPYISYLDFTHWNLRIAKLIDLKDNRWTIGVIDQPGDTGWWTSINLESQGKIHVSYYDAEHGNLRYAVGNFNGWTLKTVRSGIGAQGQFSSIDRNPADGKPAILHYNAGQGSMEYTYKSGSTSWQTLTLDYNGQDVGFASSLDISSTDFPNISYFNATTSFMKYALAIGDGYWAKYYPTTSVYNGYYSSLKLNSSNQPRIATYLSAEGYLLYLYNTGSGWSAQYIDTEDNVGQYVSLAIDSLNRPHVSYYNATHGNLIYGVLGVGATEWTTTTIDDTDDVGKFTSIALSSDNRFYISYFDETHNDLKIAYQTPPFGFIVKEVVDDGGVLEDDVGWFSSIALDNTGKPHISYYDITNMDLKYAYWDGVAWNKSALDSTGDVGMYTSLKIRSADNSRHLCYLDNTNSDLKYARYSGGIWEFATVAGNPIVGNDGDVGYSCSIDLNSTGLTAISYYDNTGRDLMLAMDTNYTLPPIVAKLLFPIVRRPPPD